MQRRQVGDGHRSRVRLGTRTFRTNDVIRTAIIRAAAPRNGSAAAGGPERNARRRRFVDRGMTAARRVVAADFGGPENLRVEEIAVGEPGLGQVRVSVRAAGVNAYDAKVYAGPGDRSRLPIRLGYEAAGVVSAVGHEVTRWSPGDDVIVFPTTGAYATELVVDATALTAKPAALPWAEAAGLLLTGAAAWHALDAAEVGPGDVVVVHGASGGVGLYAVQLATLREARVIATAGHAAHPLLRELGAEPVMYGDGLLSRVRELAPPTGVDAALDLVGTDEAMDVSLALVPDRSRVVSIANFDRAPREGVQLLGNGPGADPGTEVRNAARPELARLAGQGKLRVFVASTYPLDDAAEAHRQIRTGHTTGKLVLWI
jgi:NADPH2:quinone reductase